MSYGDIHKVMRNFMTRIAKSEIFEKAANVTELKYDICQQLYFKFILSPKRPKKIT